jgi:hypothetical protein
MLASGSKVYLGGSFTTVGGQPRQMIAAVDESTGIPDAILTGGASASVTALAINGSTLYAGGSFTTFMGQQLYRMGAVDINTGAATAWNPTATGTAQAGVNPTVLARWW